MLKILSMGIALVATTSAHASWEGNVEAYYTPPEIDLLGRFEVKAYSYACHSNASLEADDVFYYEKGEIIEHQSDTSSKNVTLDPNGKYLFLTKDNCWVAANREWLHPVDVLPYPANYFSEIEIKFYSKFNVKAWNYACHKRASMMSKNVSIYHKNSVIYLIIDRPDHQRIVRNEGRIWFLTTRGCWVTSSREYLQPMVNYPVDWW